MLAYEKALVKTDSALGDKREAWIKNLKKDIYVEEAVNVLKELRMNNIKNDNKTKWSVKD
jgi:carboxyl-terminal processing protease